MSTRGSANLQDLFSALDREIETLEKEFYALEKEYHQLEPRFQELDQRLTDVLSALEKRGHPPVSRRIRTLKEVITRLHEQRGYNVDDFGRIARLFRILQTRLPEELLPTRLRERWKERLRAEITEEQEQKRRKQRRYKKFPYKFLLLENGDMHFALQYQQRLWSHKIRPSREPDSNGLTIEVRSLKKPQRQRFYRLPGRGVLEDAAQSFEAVLLENARGKPAGFLTERIEGILFLSQRTYKQKLRYFELDSGAKAPYLTLRGNRYYLRSW